MKPTIARLVWLAGVAAVCFGVHLIGVSAKVAVGVWVIVTALYVIGWAAEATRTPRP